MEIHLNFNKITVKIPGSNESLETSLNTGHSSLKSVINWLKNPHIGFPTQFRNWLLTRAEDSLKNTIISDAKTILKANPDVQLVLVPTEDGCILKLANAQEPQMEAEDGRMEPQPEPVEAKEVAEDRRMEPQPQQTELKFLMFLPFEAFIEKNIHTVFDRIRLNWDDEQLMNFLIALHNQRIDPEFLIHSAGISRLMINRVRKLQASPSKEEINRIISDIKSYNADEDFRRKVQSEELDIDPVIAGRKKWLIGKEKTFFSLLSDPKLPLNEKQKTEMVQDLAYLTYAKWIKDIPENEYDQHWDLIMGELSKDIFLKVNRLYPR